MQDIKTQGYRSLRIWNKAKELIKTVYRITDTFPRSEEYNLVSQMRRAALSVLLNIAEGHRRRSSQKEFLRFLNMADGSLVEVEACAEISLDLNRMSESDHTKLEQTRQEVARMLSSFKKKVAQN